MNHPWAASGGVPTYTGSRNGCDSRAGFRPPKGNGPGWRAAGGRSACRPERHFHPDAGAAGPSGAPLPEFPAPVFIGRIKVRARRSRVFFMARAGRAGHMRPGCSTGSKRQGYVRFGAPTLRQAKWLVGGRRPSPLRRSRHTIEGPAVCGSRRSPTGRQCRPLRRAPNCPQRGTSWAVASLCVGAARGIRNNWTLRRVRPRRPPKPAVFVCVRVESTLRLHPTPTKPSSPPRISPPQDRRDGFSCPANLPFPVPRGPDRNRRSRPCRTDSPVCP